MGEELYLRHRDSAMNASDRAYLLATEIENMRLRARLAQAENALQYYANPDNTVRECMAGGCCANCDLTRKANDFLCTKRDSA